MYLKNNLCYKLTNLLLWYNGGYHASFILKGLYFDPGQQQVAKQRLPKIELGTFSCKNNVIIITTPQQQVV